MEQKELSLQLKDKGNEFFKQKKYQQAIDAYSQAIVSLSLIAFFGSNSTILTKLTFSIGPNATRNSATTASRCWTRGRL